MTARRLKDVDFPRWDRRRWGLAMAGTLLWPGTGAAQDAPAWAREGRVQLDYDVAAQARGLPLRASSRLQWRRSAGTYEAELDLRAALLGTRTQRSSGLWDAQGLRPQTFSDQARRLRRYELDWNTQRYRFFREASMVHEGALRPGTQDRLSLFFAIAAWAHQQSTWTLSTALTLPVLAQTATEDWRFDWAATETLDTPAGRMLTQRLERVPRDAGDTRMTLWLAPTAGLLPARILLQESNGDQVDQRLRSAAGIPIHAS